MRKIPLLVLVALLAAAAGAQAISFGFGDPIFETSLNEIGASAKLDMAGFTAEISLQWGLPAVKVQATLSQGLAPAEVYLAAGLAAISGKSIEIVVETYKKNKAKGWGAIAKDLGIKPGSKEFKALKDKAGAAAEKIKNKKKG